jgi:thiamine-phosphate diphosphorylase
MSATDAAEIPVVHAVTTRAILGRPDFLTTARAVMQALGSRGALHLRAERAGAAGAAGAAVPVTARMLYALAAALAPDQDATGAWLVVNERVDIALAAGARAVQLPAHGLGVADATAAARAAHRPLRVGVSIHASDESSLAAGAAWVVVGHLLATPSHAGETPHGPALVRAIAAASAVPIIGIGGVRPEHIAALRAAGVTGVAAIRGIWAEDDAARAATSYLSAYDAGDDATACDAGARGRIGRPHGQR